MNPVESGGLCRDDERKKNETPFTYLNRHQSFGGKGNQYLLVAKNNIFWKHSDVNEKCFVLKFLALLRAPKGIKGRHEATRPLQAIFKDTLWILNSGSSLPFTFFMPLSASFALTAIDAHKVLAKVVKSYWRSSFLPPLFLMRVPKWPKMPSVERKQRRKCISFILHYITNKLCKVKIFPISSNPFNRPNPGQQKVRSVNEAHTE